MLSETLCELKKPLREVCRCVESLASNGSSVSRREIREALQAPDSTVRGWLGQLVALEFLTAERPRGGAGKSTRYRLTGRPLPGRASLGLLAPEDLASRTGEGAGAREGRSRDLSG